MRFVLILLLATCGLRAANLMPNSSFEIGVGRGWNMYQSSGSSVLGNVGPLVSMLTNDGVHGGRAMLVPANAALYSRDMWLLSGNYTATWYAKTFSGIQGPYAAGWMHAAGASESDPVRGGDIPSFGNYSGSWTRYTNAFVAPSNGLYCLAFGGTQPYYAIDAIQVETNTATAYAPSLDVEFALSTPGTNSIYYRSDTAQVQFNFRNEGALTTVRVGYQDFNYMNSNLVGEATFNFVLPPGTNTNTIVNFPTHYGSHRTVARDYDRNDSGDEMTWTHYSFPSNFVINATNDWLGGHPNGSDYHTDLMIRKGFKLSRGLSVNPNNFRWNALQTSRGAPFTFTDSSVTNQMAKMGFLAPITMDFDGDTWPVWATNTIAETRLEFPYVGQWNNMDWSNLFYNVTLQYKNKHLYAIEIGPNEPYQSGPCYSTNGNDCFGEDTEADNRPINSRVATNYAKMVTYAYHGITNADPNHTIKVVAVAGALGNGDWGRKVWTNLHANVQGRIDAISTHIFPVDQGTDPNLPYDPRNTSTRANGWRTNFAGVRPIWNTETELINGALVKGLNASWPIFYNLHTVISPSAEAFRAKAQVRPQNSLVQQLSEVLRCKGNGFDKIFYYDMRDFQDSYYAGDNVYGYDYMRVDSPTLVSLSTASERFVQFGFGEITNAGSYYLEGYSYTNRAGQATAAMWHDYRSNCTFTVSNPFMAQFDPMGNLLATNTTTFKVTRFPSYFLSDLMTAAQLSNNLALATVAHGVAATVGPQLSFDIFPSGLWNGTWMSGSNAALIKWTANDATYTAYNVNGVPTANSTNILFKWSLDGAAYNTYSQTTHVWLASIADGNHTFRVKAKNKENIETEWTHVFSPEQALGGSSGTNKIHVSGPMNIGTITIAQ